MAAMAASWPISVKLGATAVRRTSPASWNSSPRTRKRPRLRRILLNSPMRERRRRPVVVNRVKAQTAPAKMISAAGCLDDVGQPSDQLLHSGLGHQFS